MPRSRTRRAASPLVALLAGPLLLTGCAPELVDGTIEPFTSAGGRLVSREDCTAQFECVTLTVPSDHFAPASREWEVTFALRPGDAGMSVTLPFAVLGLDEDGRLAGTFRGEPVR